LQPNLVNVPIKSNQVKIDDTTNPCGSTSLYRLAGMSDHSIFNHTKPFLDHVQELNHAPEAEVIAVFKLLCQGVTTPGRGSFNPALETILDRVAYFPLRPADMKTELVKVGMAESMSGQLSEVWAEQARAVVNQRKKVDSDVKDVNYEILTDIVTGVERINLKFDLNHPRSADVFSRSADVTSARLQTAELTFTPDQLFALYDQLEAVQKRIDKICS